MKYAFRLGLVLAIASASCSPSFAGPSPLSPTALATSGDGNTLYIACATANEIAVFDTATRRVMHKIAMPASPIGLVLSGDGKTLYVTCAAPESFVSLLNTAGAKIMA